MLRLTWSLINIVCLFAFFYAFVKAVKLLWESKRWLAVVFVMGFFGYKSMRSTSSANLKAKKSESFQEVDLTPLSPPTIPLNSLVLQTIDNGLSQSLILTGVYRRDSTRLSLDAGTTHLSGLVIGFNWVPGPVYVADGVSGGVAESTIRYTAVGTLEWTLLGLTLWTQGGREFKGELAVASSPKFLP